MWIYSGDKHVHKVCICVSNCTAVSDCPVLQASLGEGTRFATSGRVGFTLWFALTRQKIRMQ